MSVPGPEPPELETRLLGTPDSGSALRGNIRLAHRARVCEREIHSGEVFAHHYRPASAKQLEPRNERRGRGARPAYGGTSIPCRT